ncbi:MAG: hypothetical protein WCU88_10260 [Elusimicrobiota bacterium]|jgi:hypothetical protein
MNRLRIALLCTLAAWISMSARPASAAMSPEDFSRKAKEWTNKAKAFTQLDCKAMHDIWEAACGADSEPTETGDRNAMRAQAQKIGQEIKSKADPLAAEYKELDKWRDDWVKSFPLPKETEPVVKDMDKQWERIVKIQANGSLRGVNHPLVQQAEEYGKQQHKRMEAESRHSCGVKDTAFVGGDERPDCVSGAMCTIFEFKPENSRARGKGQSQLSRYQKQVTSYYQSCIDGRKIPDSKFGGKDMISKIVGKCLKSGKVEFKTSLSTYKMCELKYQCAQ